MNVFANPLFLCYAIFCMNNETEKSQNPSSSNEDLQKKINSFFSLSGVFSIRPAINKGIKKLEERYGNTEAYTGIRTGYNRFDDMTSGLKEGALVVLSAKPGMGKSTLVRNWISRSAANYNCPCFLISTSESAETITTGMLCAEGKIDTQKFHAGYLETQDWINLVKAASMINEMPLWLKISSLFVIEELMNLLDAWKEKIPIEYFPRIVVIDDIHGVTRNQPSNHQKENLSYILRMLRSVALKFSLSIVIVHSSKTKLEDTRYPNRPNVADFSEEEGPLETEADLLCFLYREEVYELDTPDRGIAELIVAKNRTGPTGTVRLRFLPYYARFENLLEDHKSS